MDITVHFCGPTVKQLRREWHAAVQRGQSRLIRHISALLEVGAGRIRVDARGAQLLERAEAHLEFVGL